VSETVKNIVPDTGSATDMLKPLDAVVPDPKDTPESAGSGRDNVTQKVTSSVRGNGASDLTAGNMVRPGKAFTDAKRAGEQVRTALSDTADQLRSTVKSSLGGITGAAKKVSETAGAPSASRDTAGSEKASADSDS